MISITEDIRPPFMIGNSIRVTNVAPFAHIWEYLATGSQSLHTTVWITAGQAVCNFGAKKILAVPNYLTVQVGEAEHILLNPEYLQYINHSCDPNVFFDTETMTISALRNIDIGEELTFFYPSTEWTMDRAFDCSCYADCCLGTIQGAAHLSPDILATYQLTSYITRKANLQHAVNRHNRGR